MRRVLLSNGCYYHIYNRGVEKRNIFFDKHDYRRFLETVDFYRKTPTPMKLSDFRRGKIQLKKIESQEDLVRIFCYCLMPNHFHILVEQLADNGVSTFMRKFSDSYTRYLNTKRKRIGPLFQGPFKAKLIDSEAYLLQVSKYIHKNSNELEFPHPVWEGEVYPYSSYGYYISEGKHPFCDMDLILDYFSKTNPGLDYQSFVEEEMIDDPALFGSFIEED